MVYKSSMNAIGGSGGGLPDESGHANDFLTTDGSTASWISTGYTVFQASDNTGATDITSELETAIETAWANNKTLLIPEGTYWAQSCDPDSGIVIEGADQDSVTFIATNDAPFFRTQTSQRAHWIANSTSYTTTGTAAVQMALYVDPKTSNTDYVSCITVNTTAGIKSGDILRIFCQNDHPYPYIQLGNNPLATTNGSKVVVVTHSRHGFSTNDVIRLWDTSGAITDVNGIPRAEVFSYPTNIKDQTITRIDADSYSFTVSTTNATSTASTGALVVRDVKRKAFFGEDFTVLGTYPTQIFVNGRLAWHDFYTDGVRINSIPLDRKFHIKNITFKGKRTSGKVTKANVTTFGTGYVSNPTVVVDNTGTGGSGFAATASRWSEVSFITVTNGGSGYTSVPTVVVDNSGTGGTGCAAYATIQNGAVASVTVTVSGSGYNSPPAISFTGGGGASAAATAVGPGGVSAITISNHGTGYNSAPTISFSGGSGSGAAATAVVDGDPYDADYDNTTSFHNHILGLWYCPYALVENCHFENLWEGAGEFRHGPFGLMQNCTGKLLPNFKTAVTGFAGRLGYFGYSYNSSYFRMNGCRIEQARHGYTDGNTESPTYSTSDWPDYGLPVNVSISDCEFINTWGTSIGPHEGANGVFIQGCTVIAPQQSDQISSYKGCGIQVRGCNFKVIDYYQQGGGDGIRYQPTEQPTGQHYFDAVRIENLWVSDEQSHAFRFPDASGTIYKSPIIIGDFFAIGVGKGARFDSGANVNVYGQYNVSGIRGRGLQISTGATFIADKVSLDFTTVQTNPTPSSRRAISLDTTTTTIIRNLDITLGATVNPTVIFDYGTATPSATLALGKWSIYNPSSVSLPTLITTSNAANYTWSTIDTTIVRQAQNTQTGATYTFLNADGGKNVLGNRATAQTFTLPNYLPAGWNAVIQQIGAGAITLSAAAGATLNGTASTVNQYDVLLVYCNTNADGSSAVYNSAYIGATSGAAKSQVFDMCGFIEGPTNKAYTIAYNLDFGGTINATKTICTSGTATATFKINTTALGGAANSVSSSGDSVTQSSANTFVAGDKLSVTISSNASCIDFAWTMKFTRTLA